MSVAVSIPPQKRLVEKIAGPEARVTVLIPPGGNPAVYEPAPSRMKAVEKARLYFSIGVPFEKNWLPRFKSANKNLKVVAMHSALKRRHMKNAHQHHHAPHEHEDGRDPHVWLSPPHVRRMVPTIRESLCTAQPEKCPAFRRRAANFVKQINTLDARLAKKFSAPLPRREFMVFHPSWGYFADTYGLEQVPIESAGKSPGAKELSILLKQAEEHGISTLFAHPQFSKRPAKALARRLKGKMVLIDPLAEEWAENLEAAAEKIHGSLTGEAR